MCVLKRHAVIWVQVHTRLLKDVYLTITTNKRIFGNSVLEMPIYS